MNKKTETGKTAKQPSESALEWKPTKEDKIFLRSCNIQVEGAVAAEART